MNLGDLAQGGGRPELMQLLARGRGGMGGKIGGMGGPINNVSPAQFGQMPEGGYPAQPNEPQHRMPPGVDRPPIRYPPYYPFPTGQGLEQQSAPAFPGGIDPAAVQGGMGGGMANTGGAGLVGGGGDFRTFDLRESDMGAPRDMGVQAPSQFGGLQEMLRALMGGGAGVTGGAGLVGNGSDAMAMPGGPGMRRMRGG